MKSQQFQTIDIQLKPSMLLLGWLSFISILSGVIVWQLPLQLFIKIGLMTLLVFSGVYCVLRDALLWLPWSWQVLHVDSQGQLKMTNKRGQRFMPKLANESFVHRFLIILNTEREGLKWGLPPLVLFTHGDYQEQHRKLRVYLRWRKFQ
ncbi:MAG: hypothetical protein ACT4OH_03360 [Methylophilaceae bacterium]